MDDSDKNPKADSPASTVPTVAVMDTNPGAAGGHSLTVQVTPPPTPDETLKHIVEITSAVVWPFVALVTIILLRAKLAGLVESLAVRIRDPRTTIEAGPIKLGNELRDLKLKSEEADSRIQVLTQLESSRTGRAELVENALPEELTQLAKQYQDLNEGSLEKRIQMRDDLAAKMASLIIREGIPRSTLAAQATNDGLRTALATVVHTVPLPRDDEWLAQIGSGAEFKHTRYRIMMAVARLARLEMLSPTRAREFLKLAESYKKEADMLLVERIARTEDILSKRAH